MHENKIILVVDDDQDLANLVKNYLRAESYLVICVYDVSTAKEVLSAHKISMVISDLKMPDGNGIELIRWVKENYKIPTLLMTAFSAILETRNAAQLGITTFLSKPFTQEELLEKINPLINTHPQVEDLHSHEEQQSIEHLFREIRIEEFLAHSEVIYPVYLKLSKSKFVKVAKPGQKFTQETIHKYQEKGVHFLHAKHDEYKKYEEHTEETIALAGKIKNAKGIAPDKKDKFLVHTAKLIVEKIFLNDIDKESLYNAKKVFDLTLNIISNNTKTFDLLNYINSKGESFYAHQLGVSIYSVLLAKKLRWDSEKTLEALSIGGIFHDIGKKDIPLETLTKKCTELSKKERFALDSHPLHGAELVNNLQQFPAQVLQIILQHHERCDGSGYPFGLRRDQICPLARLVAVVDEFCKLAIQSTSKPPISPKEALNELEIKKSEFDDEILRALRKVIYS